MTFTELQAYLQQYLETNDDAVIGNIPNFMTLAAARISVDLRSFIIEKTDTLAPAQFFVLPTGFIAAKLLTVDYSSYTYVTPAKATERILGTYTINAGLIGITPAPGPASIIRFTYYVAGTTPLSNRLPHLLLHCAAAEAEMYQGNYGDATSELELYRNDYQLANGWDIQSGPISLGGTK